MLKKIGVDRLRLGMYIHDFCASWMEHPFWRTRFLLEDADDLRRIQECGIRELWIDTARGLDVAAAGETRAEVDTRIEAALTQIASAPEEPPARVSLAEEIDRAKKICAKAKGAVISMFQEARMGRAVDPQAAGALVEEISASVLRNHGALISLARLRRADDYTYMHSVAVCALMVALGRVLGLGADELHEVGLAGLLHDLGKAVMPPEVLNKPGKLTDAEFAIMKAHPLEGHRMLVAAGTLGPIPLDVTRHHHERIDGRGYPDGLAGEAISLHAKMGAVCDVYDAITSNRPYKAGWDPAESIRRMAEWQKDHFDARVFQAFVKSIGIYPVGSLVKLESGRLAIVVEQAEHSLLTPKVRAFFSTRANAHIAPELVDLALPGCADRIVSREDPAQWGFEHLERLWGA